MEPKGARTAAARPCVHPPSDEGRRHGDFVPSAGAPDLERQDVAAAPQNPVKQRARRIESFGFHIDSSFDVAEPTTSVAKLPRVTRENTSKRVPRAMHKPKAIDTVIVAASTSRSTCE